MDYSGFNRSPNVEDDRQNSQPNLIAIYRALGLTRPPEQVAQDIYSYLSNPLSYSPHTGFYPPPANNQMGQQLGLGSLPDTNQTPDPSVPSQMGDLLGALLNRYR